MKNKYFSQVLFVDDDPFMRYIVQNSLIDIFELTLCKDGLEALKWLEAGNQPDIIITDLRMPLMGGLELIRRIRSYSTTQKIAILVLSSADDSMLRIKCLEEGADDFINKPFDPKELIARINVLLRWMK